MWDDVSNAEAVDVLHTAYVDGVSVYVTLACGERKRVASTYDGGRAFATAKQFSLYGKVEIVSGFRVLWAS